MIDATAIVEGIGLLVSIAMSAFAVLKSSREKQNDTITHISNDLNAHILQDSRDITELQTNAKNIEGKLDSAIKIQSKVEDKIDRILEKLP